MTSDIKRWMWRNVERFLDSCGEVNATAMVEAWDHECSTGEATLDSEHEAWTIAVDVALAHTSDASEPRSNPAGRSATDDASDRLP